MYNIPNIKTVTPVEATIHTHCRNTKHLKKKKKKKFLKTTGQNFSTEDRMCPRKHTGVTVYGLP